MSRGNVLMAGGSHSFKDRNLIRFNKQPTPQKDTKGYMCVSVSVLVCICALRYFNKGH